MSVETIDINDAIFCSKHLKEVLLPRITPHRSTPYSHLVRFYYTQCNDCGYDGREENDGFYGFTHTDRDPIPPPTATQNKDGVYQCKKHGSLSCSQCFGWKKQITRARAAAKKAGKK
ncbi:hypothetical protein V8B97DRAFT_1918614 [Scleroderma yunnanense]